MSHLKERIWYKSYPQMKEVKIPEVSVYSLLEQTTKRFGSQTAILQDDKGITYEELKDKADRLAGAWKSLGLKKGERIGLMVGNEPGYIFSYYAAMKLGLIVVQINPRYTPKELLQIINDAEPKALVVNRGAMRTVEQVIEMHEIEHIFMSEGPASEPGNLNTLIDSNATLKESKQVDATEDVAVIQYTGGTTGTIKGAMLTHYNIVANVYQSHGMYGDEMKFGEEVILTATPLYHVYAMTSAMNLGIYIGATILLIKNFQVKQVLESVKKHKPTFFPGVPQMYNAFVNFKNVEEYGLDSLKFSTSGSAPLPAEIIREFERITEVQIGEGFGLSEASPSTHRNPAKGVRKIGSIGIPLPNTDCKILAEDGTELPVRTVGELVIKGPQVMKGYWRNEEETRNVLKDGWLYTGDLAKQDEDGYFYIVGRKKEMIINSGFNVYPQEIENVLYEHPDIQECAVIGVPDKDKGEIVKAYLVAKEGKAIDIEEVKGFCYRSLTPYKVPKEFEVIEELPRNTVGKILKRILKEKETTRGDEDE